MDEQLYELFDTRVWDTADSETYTLDEAIAHLQAQAGTEAEDDYWHGRLYFIPINLDDSYDFDYSDEIRYRDVVSDRAQP